MRVGYLCLFVCLSVCLLARDAASYNWPLLSDSVSVAVFVCLSVRSTACAI